MGVGPTNGARERGRLGLARAACPRGAVSAGLTAPAVRSRAGAQGLLGEPLVRRGSARCGGGPAVCLRRLCEWGCSRFKEGSEVPAPACAPEREADPSSPAHSWSWAGGVAG